jgi:hypothetical protein
MNNPPSTIRVVIPLKVKHRNGRPRIVPPAELDAAEEPMPDPLTLRAIARAWDWRRRLERGEAATLSDIAQAEQVTLPSSAATSGSPISRRWSSNASCSTGARAPCRSTSWPPPPWRHRRRRRIWSSRIEHRKIVSRPHRRENRRRSLTHGPRRWMGSSRNGKSHAEPDRV